MESGSSSNQQQGNTAFNFVVLENPSDALQKKTRRQVRSHVTRLQHRRAREKRSSSAATLSPHVGPSGSSISRSVSPLALSTTQQPATVGVWRDSGHEHTSPDGQSSEAHLRSVLHYFEQTGDERRRRNEEHEAQATALDVFRLPDSELGDSFSRGEMSFRTFALDDSDNTVGSSLNALGLDLAAIMTYYQNMVQIQAGDVSSQFGRSLERASRAETFYARIFTDPVLLTTCILITARQQKLGGLTGRLHSPHSWPLLEIEAFVVRSLNTALQDRSRAVTDPMILAVALCASHAAKSGNLEASHTHMKGLRQLIQIRGGLHDSPKLLSTILWLDVNTAAILGREPYVQDAAHEAEKGRLRPHLRIFRAPLETQQQGGEPNEET